MRSAVMVLHGFRVWVFVLCESTCLHHLQQILADRSVQNGLLSVVFFFLIASISERSSFQNGCLVLLLSDFPVTRDFGVFVSESSGSLLQFCLCLCLFYVAPYAEASS